MGFDGRWLWKPWLNFWSVAASLHSFVNITCTCQHSSVLCVAPKKTSNLDSYMTLTGEDQTLCGIGNHQGFLSDSATQDSVRVISSVLTKHYLILVSLIY